MSNLESNVRFILGQRCLSSLEISKLTEKKLDYFKSKQDHLRFDFTGNRDDDESYKTNCELIKLFPDIPIMIKHDYKSKLNIYKESCFWLEFHKGSCMLYDTNMNAIVDLSGKGTVEIICYLINFFGLNRYYYSPFQLINK